MVISVIIPTIQGREDLLVKCLASYEKTLASYTALGGNHELIVVGDKPTCGAAWNEGAARAKGDYLHFTADDIEALPGWWQGALSVANGVNQFATGDLPAPLVFNPDGSVQSCGGSWEQVEPDGAVTEFTRVPFLTRNQWERVGPVPPVHYYSDNYVSAKARRLGIETRVCHRYQLVHHMSPVGRLDVSADDERLYREALA